MKKCELMVKLLCHASLLKSDDSRLLKASFSAKSGIMCDNANHAHTIQTHDVECIMR